MSHSQHEPMQHAQDMIGLRLVHASIDALNGLEVTVRVKLWIASSGEV
jgi:hypothetical protein